MRLILNWNKKIFFYIVLFIVFFPPIQFGFFNSYLVFKFFLLIFFLKVVVFKKNNHPIPIFSDILLLIFFICSSLSVFQTIDIPNFLKGYFNILYGFILYYCIYLSNFNINSFKKIISLLLISFFLIHAVRFIILLTPETVLNFFSFFIHNEYIKLINFHLQNKKVYFFPWIDSFSVIFLSFFSQILFNNKKNKKQYAFILIFIYVIFFLIMIFNFIFNGFRSNLLIFLFNFVYFLLVMSNLKNIDKLKFILFPTFLLFFFSFLTKNTLFFIRFKSSIDRLILNENYDFLTLKFRFIQIYDILFSFPFLLFGVGNKNTIFYLNNINKELFSIIDRNSREIFLITQNPHNIFLEKYLESGFIGVFFFIVLLIHYFIEDLKFLNFNNLDSKKEKFFTINFFICGFWALIIYSFFNPANNDLNFNIFFFMSRAILTKFYFSKRLSNRALVSK